MTKPLRESLQDGPDPVRHNLVGQRLGRKGAETRERAVAAMLKLLSDPDGPPVTLTSVAREAQVGMTTLYLYFPDLGELLLAALKRVMDTADEAFMDRLDGRWPDETLGECCLEFLKAHLEFWTRHARLLHMRNSFADAYDTRVLKYRSRATMPLIEKLILQMDAQLTEPRDACFHMATVVLTGLERMATVVTNPHFRIVNLSHGVEDQDAYIAELIKAEARLVELAVRDWRARAKA
jgi:AcrR family transcriptional regulator